ncbi:hypothetical protein E6P09_10190 [Haloferax mediterranei ATCC 33500]|uniref:DUF7511 domain-containing protein n=1 Tax=Haloferax mediterranei (strain ATCC 33500 / DSM 1411 / JCM 8866 / NBRC 14739 / NCIMB 2177 / R-4) TaxID=523841 RepID=I3R4I2_HALMT|nr:hypothetical protein [Haloferax mediterranei]AFK19142.1 hypothetical protein HFX_1432 [Haloferax mediterranei ATCC 33500]AHZ21496.1 hypothetical protein BM92_01995 [Haloferax mediterranei ATCC 33500]MDX5989239.1 hypothetical protein [Haloferax mediterranei ATCC 33500]QCQ75613.1 hypothetical protein E6P09_10190 [Haloferax mediterranei ATCC 33500]
MSEVPGPQDSVARTADRSGADTAGDCLLHSVVVTYRGGPDQVTLYPRRDSCCDQMEAWLTADIGAFVSLDEMC